MPNHLTLPCRPWRGHILDTEHGLVPWVVSHSRTSPSPRKHQGCHDVALLKNYHLGEQKSRDARATPKKAPLGLVLLPTPNIESRHYTCGAALRNSQKDDSTNAQYMSKRTPNMKLPYSETGYQPLLAFIVGKARVRRYQVEKDLVSMRSWLNWQHQGSNLQPSASNTGVLCHIIWVFPIPTLHPLPWLPE